VDFNNLCAIIALSSSANLDHFLVELLESQHICKFATFFAVPIDIFSARFFFL
jgi:hypothetical protein